MNTEYGAYCCRVCAFIAHLYCTEDYWLRDETAHSSVNLESLPKESIPLVTNDRGRYYILANSHQHNLVLSDEEFTDHKLCDGCMGLISSASFYSRMQCNFFLHTACAQLPRKKRHPCHQHTLTLLSRQLPRAACSIVLLVSIIVMDSSTAVLSVPTTSTLAFNVVWFRKP
ncbi:hypothetical protein SLA2020_262520 [Shorea laevis]